MDKLTSSFLIGAALITVMPLDAQEVGQLYHITGCENGELVVPTPNVWSSSQRLLGPRPTVVGRLSGDGRADQGLQCQGSVVRLLNSEVAEGRTVFQIESVVNGLRGWITELFIGREFPQERCGEMFTDPEHLRRCHGGARQRVSCPGIGTKELEDRDLQFSRYLNGQIQKKQLPPSFAQLVTKTYYGLDESG